MSLCIAVVTPEGIVVVGESRQTQIIAGVNRIGSDSAVKVFELTETVLAAATGTAFMQPAGSAIQKNISSLVEDFKPSIPEGSTVQAIVELLWTYFNTVYQQHIVQYPNAAVQAGQAAVTFEVAGYDPGSRTGLLFAFDIPSVAAPAVALRTTNSPGAWWIGQADVVSRIMIGYDYRALSLPFVQAANQNGNEATNALNGLNYAVYFNTMTIQDAIDFAVGMIQITIIIQKFTAGIMTQLGGIAGVGGPIDVAVVLPGEKVRWVRRKELHI